MALEPPSDPLTRALDAVRTTAPGWDEVRSAAWRRIRALTPPGDPVALRASDGSTYQDEDGSRSLVSSRVLRAALRRLLSASATHAPSTIDLTVDDTRLVGVEIDLVAAYGTPLPELVERVRTDVVTELDGLLGAGSVPPGVVGITVVDVVVGDPRVV